MEKRNHPVDNPTALGRSASTDEQLRFAIAQKRLIRVTYGGRTRIAEPHDYGVKNATRKLLMYQLRGVSAGRAAIHDQKPETGWRLLEVSKIEACNVLEETFAGSRAQSSQRHTTWDEVFARVG